jgi:hypothetical protein
LKKEKVPIEEFVEKLGLPEESVQKALDNEKWDWLNQKKFALEILRNSKQPREMSRLQLGARLKAKYEAVMRNPERLYDEICRRKEEKIFPKQERSHPGVRLTGDPIEEDTEKY